MHRVRCCVTRAVLLMPPDPSPVELTTAGDCFGRDRLVPSIDVRLERGTFGE